MLPEGRLLLESGPRQFDRMFELEAHSQTSADLLNYGLSNLRYITKVIAADG
jgi:hypothetical protein